MFLNLRVDVLVGWQYLARIHRRQDVRQQEAQDHRQLAPIASPNWIKFAAWTSSY